MMHLIFDGHPWFAPKRRGYGTGLPIRWQGWVMLVMHIALITGVSVLLRNRPMAMVLAVVLAGLCARAALSCQDRRRLALEIGGAQASDGAEPDGYRPAPAFFGYRPDRGPPPLAPQGVDG